MTYYIEKGCIGCHFCQLECPVQAITIREGRYQIDEDKCIGCGKCAELCRLNLIRSTQPQPAPAPHEPLELTCQLLVVGMGGVGTAAAARGADLGLDVVAIEAAKHFGGGTWFAHGASFPGSVSVAAKRGFDSGLERQVQFWLGMKENGVADIDKLRQNVAENGAFLDWFDALDPENLAGFVTPPAPSPMPLDLKERYLNTRSTDDSIGPGWMGSWITQRLFDTAIQKGVRYYSETRARAFLRDADGTVCGVRATDAGGELVIRARAMILGTGGYMMNDARMRAIDPDMVTDQKSFLRLNVPTNVGDGHDMCRELGAAVDYGQGGVRGPTHHPYSYAVNKLLMCPELTFYSEAGQRLFELSNDMPAGGAPIVGPDCRASEAILRQPHGRAWAVLDSALLEKLGSQMRPMDNGQPQPWREEIQAETALEDLPARKADTLAELEAKLGCGSGVLCAAVARYNAAVAAGEDADFGKPAQYLHPIVQPPFYGFLVQNFDNGASRGGISIDHDFRLLRPDGSVIPGVWVAGDAATYSWHEDVGPTGLCGGLGGSWASGYHLAGLARDYINQ